MTRPEIRFGLWTMAIAAALFFHGGPVHAAAATTAIETAGPVAAAATEGSYRLAQNGERRKRSREGHDGARHRKRGGGDARNRGGGRHEMRPRRHDGGGHRANRRPRGGSSGGIGIYIYPFTLYDYDPYYYNHGPYYRPYYQGRLSCETVRRMVEEAGYRRVRSDDCRGKIYGYFARRGKRNYYVNASAYTGRIVSVHRR